jgi:hypothetical protein
MKCRYKEDQDFVDALKVLDMEYPGINPRTENIIEENPGRPYREKVVQLLMWIRMNTYVPNFETIAYVNYKNLVNEIKELFGIELKTVPIKMRIE